MMTGKPLHELNLLALLTVMSGPILVAEAVVAQPSKPITIAELGSPGVKAHTRLAKNELVPAPRNTTVTQGESSLVQLTDIRLELTETGLQIVLEATGELATPTTSVSGNALIVEIPEAVLPEPFQEFAPVTGIALVQATALPGNLVQISITGSDAPPTVAVNVDATNLALTVVPGSASTERRDEDAIQLVVTGEEGGYVVPNTTTATRTDTPLRDIPQSVQVIPQEVLEDQQAIRLNDALRNVSGVVTGSNDPRGQRFTIRGFDSSSVLRDGFRLTDGGTGNVGFPELANIEQIEVLKGPAAILFGALEPGGVINLVSKRPLSEPTYELGLRLGNRALVEPSIDFSGPLSEDGRVRYRLNALYRREDYHRDFNTSIERYFIAPVLSWQISDHTDLILELEYRDDRRPNDFGLVAVGDEVADIPFDRALNNRSLISTSDYLRAGYQFEHRFNDAWKVRNAFYYTLYDTNVIVSFGPGFDETLGAIVNVPVQLAQPTDTFELQTNVVGEFSTGSIEHTLLAGIDLYRRQDDGSEARGDLGVTNFLDIFDPDYNSLVTPDFDTAPILLSSEGTTDNLGVYLQDQIALLDNLKLLLGFRYDTVSQDSISSSIFDPAGSETSRSDDAFSPRVGLVYQPIDEVSLYTSYSRSFAPNFGTTVSGDILEPERGTQFEIGTRAELLDGRLVANLALFNLVKENVATTDPDNVLFSIAVGEQRSRGVELDVIGEILPGWNVVANYAYTDTEITEDNDGLEGNRLFGVPEHNFNLWTTYDFQEGALAGLGLGLGFNFVGERLGDNENSFTLDSYFLTNAAVSYQQDNWQIGLNFRNLFDIDYIESAENSRFTEINPGEGFTVIGSVSVEF